MVLNPELYQQLGRRFGDVRISNAGLPMVWRSQSERGRPRRYIDKARRDHPGEAYCVCCPYCGDSRYRLYMNHRWGVYDPETKSRNLWLAHCHNEDCVNTYDQRQALYKYVWDNTSPPPSHLSRTPAHRPQSSPDEVRPPGIIWPLDRVPDDNPAYQYLVGRGFNPAFLRHYFGVGIVLEPNADNRMAKDRIYIPVWMNDKLMGWQARLAYDVPKSDKKAPPKYIFNRGFPRSQVLYNFDSAKRWPIVVVVEGASKVWRFGPEAVATFGKCVTGYQAVLLQNHWEKIIVVLDPNALEESKDLVKILQARKQVALVQLPNGLEPDEMETTEVRRLVFAEAQRQGMVIPVPYGPCPSAK